MLIYSTSNSVEHAVSTKDGPKTLKFYPISPRVLGQMRGLFKPVIKALSQFATAASQDVGRESVDTRGANGEQQIKATIQPISLEMARYRSGQRESAVDMMVDNLMSEAAINTIGVLIMDSLRDDYAGKWKDAKEVTSFIDSIDMDTMTELLHGVAKANAKVIRPLMQKLGGIGQIFQQVAKRMTESLGQEDLPSNAPSQETSTTASGSA